MSETTYLTMDDVIDLHDDIVRRTGTAPAALRGGGEELLESALTSARWAAHYEDADLITQAVRIAVAISQNQPFEDGNKRAGYITAVVFLKMNRLLVVDPDMEFARRLQRVAEVSRGPDRDLVVADLVEWMRLACEAEPPQ